MRIWVLFLCFIFICANYTLAQVDLDQIVVTKYGQGKNLPINSESSIFKNLENINLDLQSRAPFKDIQADFSLRGSTFEGTGVVFEGISVNDPQTGHFHADLPFTTQDLQSFEKSSLVNGQFYPQALAGAVNFEIKKPQKDSGVITSGLGRYNLVSEALSITKRYSDFGSRLSLETQQTDGYRLATDFRKFVGRIDNSLDLPSAEIKFGAGYLEKEFGAYDFYTPGKGYPSQEWTKTWLVNSSADIDGDGFNFYPAFLWRRHDDKFLLDKTLLRSNYLNHHRTDIYSPQFLTGQKVSWGEWKAGVEAREEVMSSSNLGKHTRNAKSALVNSKIDSLGRFTLEDSLRFDRYSSFGEVVNGSATLSYNLDAKKKIYAGFARSFRPPSFTELYYNDPTTLGDALLGAEKANTYEAGFKLSDKRISLNFCGYVRQEKNLIDWVKRTSSQAKWQAENISSSLVSGAETDLALNINSKTKLGLRYAYANKRFDDQGYLFKYGPNYTRHLAGANFHKEIDNFTYAASLTYKKKPGRDGWVIADVSTDYLLKKNPDLKLYFAVSNIFNVEYQEIEGVPQPGIWPEAGLRLEW